MSRTAFGRHVSRGLRIVPHALGVAVLFLHVAGAGGLAGQTGSETVTFAKDIAPIFQRSCQQCHQPGAVGPMSLTTYDEVRPWASRSSRRLSWARCLRIDMTAESAFKTSSTTCVSAKRKFRRFLAGSMPARLPAIRQNFRRALVPRSQQVGFCGPVRAAGPHYSYQAVHRRSERAGRVVAAGCAHGRDAG